MWGKYHGYQQKLLYRDTIRKMIHDEIDYEQKLTMQNQPKKAGILEKPVNIM